MKNRIFFNLLLVLTIFVALPIFVFAETSFVDSVAAEIERDKYLIQEEYKNNQIDVSQVFDQGANKNPQQQNTDEKTNSSNTETLRQGTQTDSQISGENSFTEERFNSSSSTKTFSWSDLWPWKKEKKQTPAKQYNPDANLVHQPDENITTHSTARDLPSTQKTQDYSPEIDSYTPKYHNPYLENNDQGYRAPEKETLNYSGLLIIIFLLFVAVVLVYMIVRRKRKIRTKLNIQARGNHHRSAVADFSDQSRPAAALDSSRQRYFIKRTGTGKPPLNKQ